MEYLNRVLGIHVFYLEEILKRERGADMIIHLGDGGDARPLHEEAQGRARMLPM